MIHTIEEFMEMWQRQSDGTRKIMAALTDESLKQEVAEIKIKVAVLENREEHHSVNWDRVISVGMAIVQALILWKLFGA